MQKSNNGKYYVLTGSNAVMICSNWEQAEYCFHTYICSPKRLHSYRSFVLAQRAALDHLHLIAYGIPCPDELPIGQVVTVRQLLHDSKDVQQGDEPDAYP